MRIVVANLKLFYQNSELWYVYAVFTCLACFSVALLDVVAV